MSISETISTHTWQGLDVVQHFAFSVEFSFELEAIPTINVKVGVRNVFGLAQVVLVIVRIAALFKSLHQNRSSIPTDPSARRVRSSVECPTNRVLRVRVGEQECWD